MIVLSILCAILTIAIFILSLPVRSTILILKTNIKLMEQRASKEKGNRPEAKKTLLKNAVYLAQKALLNTLRLLLNFLRTIASILSIFTSTIVIIIVLAVMIMIAAISAVLFVVMDDNFKYTPTNTDAIRNKTKKESSADKTADISGWLDACQQAWTYCRKKGWSYSWSTKSDKKYGTVRLDCTGYVTLCLQFYGTVKSPNHNVPNSDTIADFIKGYKKQWEVIEWTSDAKLKKGDILIRPKKLGNGHACIYAGNGRYFNNGTVGSSFPDREGPTVKGRYNFWNTGMTTGCYIARLKGVSGGDADKLLAGAKIAWDTAKQKKPTYYSSSGGYKMMTVKGYGSVRPDCSGMVGAALYIGGFGNSYYSCCVTSTAYWDSALTNKLVSKGRLKRIKKPISQWKTSKFQKGDIVIYPVHGRFGHVNIYAGNNMWYDGGSTERLHTSPVKNYDWKGRLHGQDVKILRWTS